MNNLLVQSSESLYSFLLQFYPKRYKQEFGEEMKFVFGQSLRDSYDKNGVLGLITLWTRTIIDGLKSGPLEHLENIQNILFNKKGGGYMSTKSNDIIMNNKIFLWGAIATGLLLLIPFMAMQFNWAVPDPGSTTTDGMKWNLFDFIFAGTLMFGTGSAFVLLARKAKNPTYRLAVAIGILAAFLLIWVSGAVGIIGDPEDGSADIPNLMYFGVLAIGFFGAILSRFNPKGMARTLFTVAIAQFAVPVVMLIANPQVLSDAPGVIGVFILNSFFAMCFAGSGILFKQAIPAKR